MCQVIVIAEAYYGYEVLGITITFCGGSRGAFGTEIIFSPPRIMVLGPSDNRQSNKSPQGRPTLDEQVPLHGVPQTDRKGPSNM